MMILILINVLVGFILVLGASSEYYNGEVYLHPFFWHIKLWKSTMKFRPLFRATLCILLTFVAAGYMIFVTIGDFVLLCFSVVKNIFKRS